MLQAWEIHLLTYICCRDFIDKARAGAVFCPKRQHNIPVLTCLNPPKKDALLQLFNESLADGIRRKKKFVVQHQVGLKELSRLMQTPHKVPDCSWLLLLLAAVAGPEHAIWQKGYVPPVEVDIVQPLFKQALVDNRDGFFDAAKPVSEICEI